MEKDYRLLERDNCLLVLDGAAGFMGSHGLRFGSAHYPAVIATDIRPLYDVRDANNLTFVQADIGSLESVRKIKARIADYLSRHPDHSFVYWHLGGVFNYTAPEEVLDRVNRLGTKNVIEECVLPFKERVRSFIQWSGITVHGDFDIPLPVTEKSEVKPVNIYGWSKLRAEQVVMDYARRENLPAVIMRLGGVYGPGGPPGERYGMAILIKLFAEGRINNILTSGSEKRRVALVHVEDVIRAADFLGNCPEAIGETFVIVDDTPYTSEEISRFLGEELDNPLIPFVRLPHKIFRFLLETIEKDAKRYNAKPEVDAGMGEMTLVSTFSSNKKFMDLAHKYGRGRNSKNPVMIYKDSFDGLRQTIEAYRREGWIK